MEYLDNLLITLALCGKNFFYELTHDEEGAVDLITIVVLIGIAVVLALVFRKQLKDLVETLLNTISDNAKEAVDQ